MTWMRMDRGPRTPDEHEHLLRYGFFERELSNEATEEASDEEDEEDEEETETEGVEEDVGEEEPEPAPAPKRKKSTKAMSKAQIAKALVVSDATDAAYRNAAKNITKLVKKGLLSMLTKANPDAAVVAYVKRFLGTQAGLAVVSGVAGYVLTCVPSFQNNARVQRLAREFRVASWTVLEGLVLGVVAEHFGAGFKSTIETLPKPA